jgi:hypothetical protein
MIWILLLVLLIVFTYFDYKAYRNRFPNAAKWTYFFKK